MIQPHELRIGNLIFDDDGALCKIIGFQPYGHSVRCDESEGCDILIDIYAADGKIRKGFSVESTLVNPIPLTPELLEKCGFVAEKDNWYTKKYFTNCKEQAEMNIISINSKTFRCGVCNDEDYSYAMTGKELLYLHQLQNYVRWQTGEELPVKL